MSYKEIFQRVFGIDPEDNVISISKQKSTGFSGNGVWLGSVMWDVIKVEDVVRYSSRICCSYFTYDIHKDIWEFFLDKKFIDRRTCAPRELLSLEYIKETLENIKENELESVS